MGPTHAHGSRTRERFTRRLWPGVMRQAHHASRARRPCLGAVLSAASLLCRVFLWDTLSRSWSTCARLRYDRPVIALYGDVRVWRRLDRREAWHG